MSKNKNKKPTEAEEYFFCSHITRDGYVYELLLTKVELDRATLRADKNQEDIYKDYIVLQGYKGCKHIEPDIDDFHGKMK
jgi:hypothetical protein